MDKDISLIQNNKIALQIVDRCLKSGRSINLVFIPQGNKQAVDGRSLVLGNDIEIPDEGIPLPATLEEMEKQMIIKALQRTNGVIVEAAKLLKVSRTGLGNKINKYGLQKTIEIGEGE